MSNCCKCKGKCKCKPRVVRVNSDSGGGTSIIDNNNGSFNYENAAGVPETIITNQGLLVTACDPNEGQIGEAGYTFQAAAHNVLGGPVTWDVVDSGGDIENVTIADNGDNTADVTYDAVALFANNGYGSILLEATDTSGAIAYFRQCIKLGDPVSKERLACNSDLVANSPDILVSSQLFAQTAEQYAFTDAAKTTNAVDGDTVLVLEDSAGNADLTVSPASNGPQFSDNVVNGRPALVFDGANSESLFVNNPAGVAGSPLKLAAMFRMDASSGENAPLISGMPLDPIGDSNASAVNASWQIGRGSAPSGTQDDFVFRYAGAVGNVDEVIVPWVDVADGGFHVVVVDYDGANVDVFIDGELKASFTANIPLLSAHYRVYRNRAANVFASGELAELIIGGTTMTTGQLDRIQAYLLCKYGLDSSVFAGTGPFGIDTSFYTDISQYELQTFNDGSQRVYDVVNEAYEDPEDLPVPGLGFLVTNTSTAILNSVRLANLIGIGTPAHADDADAGAGGVPPGRIYQTDGTGTPPLNVAGIVMVKQ